MMEWMFSIQNDSACLPALVLQQWWLVVGWCVVAAWLGARCARRLRLSKSVQAVTGTGVAICVGLPGPWGGAYWLGLAFQGLSVSTVLLCALLGVHGFLQPTAQNYARKLWPAHWLVWALCGVALGWVLLLDTLGVFPGLLYNWGFGAAAPAVASALVAFSWALAKSSWPNHATVLLGSAILLFLALRLPSGNLFDAMLDPCLWLALHWALFQQWRARFKPLVNAL